MVVLVGCYCIGYGTCMACEQLTIPFFFLLSTLSAYQFSIMDNRETIADAVVDISSLGLMYEVENFAHNNPVILAALAITGKSVTPWTDGRRISSSMVTRIT